MAFSATLTGTGRSCSITSGSPTITVSSATGLVVGATIQGTGIPIGTKITAINGTTVTMSANATATNATASLIFSSVYGSIVTIQLTASGDTATWQNVFNAGFGLLQGSRELFFPGAMTLQFDTIAAGAVFNHQDWTVEYGTGGRQLFDSGKLAGEHRGGYLVNGTQFIKAAGPTFIFNNWNNGTPGGSNMFTNTGSLLTKGGLIRMHNPRFVARSGFNNAFAFVSTRDDLLIENMILDYQYASGNNASIGGGYGTLKNTYVVFANSGIAKPNSTSTATIDGLFYVGLYGDSPNHKFAIPNGFTLDGYAPQVLSTQLLGGFQDNTTETFSNINLSTAGWGLNDLKTNYRRYGGPNEIRFPRTVSFQFNDSTATDLTGVTLYISSNGASVINAVQAGDYNALTQALVLNWTASVASYRVANTITDTINQVAQFRKAGYVSQSVSYSLNTASYSQPIFMLADPAMGSVTPAQAALITGVTPDYTNKVLTGSASRNLDEVYAFGSYSQALPANSAQPDYQTSDGGVYRLLTTWKLNWTAGALTMGEYNKTIRSSTQWKFGNTASLNLDKDDVLWTPAVRGDLFQFESGSALNITNGSTLTVSPTAGLGYGTATTSEFRANSMLNMSDSAVIYNLPSGAAGTVFSNSEANATWNISNSVITLNCPNNAQVAIHAYFKPESVINGLTINGTASNVVWQMGFTTNNSKMVGFKYGGAIFGNGTSNILMDAYTYTGAAATIPSNFGSSNKWWWVDPTMQAGGLFRWTAGGTPTGNAGFYGVIGFRPVIKTDKVGYAPKMRIKASAMASRYPSKIINTTAESTVALGEFFRDPTFMPNTDGFLPFVDSLDDKTVINTINWTLDFRQNGWLGQSQTFTAAAAKTGLVTYTASGAVDSNYINDTTGAADAALITVNESTRVLAAATGTLHWSAQRMYNALINKWSSFAIEQNIVAASTGGSLDLSNYTVDESIKFVRGITSDLLSQVRTSGVIQSTANEVPVADVNGSRASVFGLDPNGFGTTWHLRHRQVTALGAGAWTQTSGIGNTALILVNEGLYNVQVRAPGYDWKLLDFDTSQSLTLDVGLQAHISSANTPQYQMPFNSVLEAAFAYDAVAMSVAVTNTTGSIIQPGFAELYRATQRIQHIPELVWTWVAPVTANASTQKIIIPNGNPITMFLTAASNATVKMTCPVIHESGISADDRVKGNASGYSIILGSPATAESAGLAAQIIGDLGGPDFVSGDHGLSIIKDDQDLAKAVLDLVKTAVDAIKPRTDLIPDAPAAVGDAMTLSSVYDAAIHAASQASVDQLAFDTLTLEQVEDSAVLAKEASIRKLSIKVGNLEE